MRPRSLLLGLCVLAVWRPHVLAAQARAVADTAALQRLLVAEDARGTGHDGLAPLLDALQRDRHPAPPAGGPWARTVPAPRAGPDARAAAARIRRPPCAPRRRTPSRSRSAARAAPIRRRPTPRCSARVRPPSALAGALDAERDPAVADALGQSLGRLPLPDTRRGARRRGRHSRAVLGAAHAGPRPRALHARAGAASHRDTRFRHVALLRASAVASPDTMVRRLSLLTLAAAGGLDSATAVRAARDRDDETRRMTLRGAGTLSAGARAPSSSRGRSTTRAPSSAPRSPRPRAWAMGRPTAARCSR